MYQKKVELNLLLCVVVLKIDFTPFTSANSKHFIQDRGTTVATIETGGYLMPVTVKGWYISQYQVKVLLIQFTTPLYLY